MAEELAYALLTPHTLNKNRTGPVLARLLAVPTLEFVAARLYRLSAGFAAEYAAASAGVPGRPELQAAYTRYLTTGLPAGDAAYNPALLLLFQGPDAVRTLAEAVGFLDSIAGGTGVRATFGELAVGPDGKATHFEPAVLTAHDAASNAAQLRLFAKHAQSDGGVHEDAAKRLAFGGADVQTTLLMLKPENFAKPSRRPGAILDIFSGTGLRLAAANLFSMSPAQADEFYGPLLPMFRERFQPNVAAKIKEALSPVFGFAIPDAVYDQFAATLTDRNARHEFDKIASYITGVDVSAIEGEARKAPGKTRMLALLLTGPDAIAKVRKGLGATNPAKAEPGTVRADFGRDLMVNGGHASDAPENAARERGIIGLTGAEPGPSIVERLIAERVK